MYFKLSKIQQFYLSLNKKMVSIYSIQEGGNSSKTRIERQFFQVLSRFLAEKKLLSSELYFVPKRAILNVVKKNKNLVAN
jgi:hypothetical protein